MTDRFSRRFGRVFCALAIAIVSAAVALAQTSRPSPSDPAKETRRSETVALGVEHVVLRRGDFTPGVETERWTINALILDPKKVKLALGRALDEGVGTETPSSMASRHDALAAVNGGYFRTAGLYRGDPVGVIEVSGRVLSEPERKRPGLAVADMEGGIRAVPVLVDFKAEIVSENGSSRRVDGVNCPRGANELILFTPEFHRTTLTGQQGIEVIVKGVSVADVRDRKGSCEIPEGGYVASASGKARQWVLDNIRPGERLDLRQKATLDPELPFVPDFIVGGGPILVKEGKAGPALDPGAYDPGFLHKRHPRTAAGMRADGIIVLVTVDGRQIATSVGMTIPELGALMIEFGCVEAINLDGGGSTAMVIKGNVVNSPSDAGGERPVSDAILVFVR